MQLTGAALVEQYVIVIEPGPISSRPERPRPADTGSRRLPLSTDRGPGYAGIVRYDERGARVFETGAAPVDNLRETNQLEIRQLRYLLKVADTGSFSKASRAAHIAQSALSSRIGELESELGVQLLHRKRSGVELTEHGHVFYRHAQRIVRQLDDLPGVVRQVGEEITGRVAVGLPASSALRFASALLDEAAQQYPGIALELFDEPSGNLRRGVDSGRLDLAIMVTEEDARLMDAVPLMEEELFFVASASTVLPNKMPIAQVARQRMALPSLHHGVRSLVDNAVRAAGSELPAPAVEANSLGIILYSVQRGLGHSILPWVSVEEKVTSGALRAVPLDPPLCRTVQACCSSEEVLSPAVAAIRALLLRTVRRQVAAGLWRGVRLL